MFMSSECKTCHLVKDVLIRIAWQEQQTIIFFTCWITGRDDFYSKVEPPTRRGWQASKQNVFQGRPICVAGQFFDRIFISSIESICLDHVWKRNLHENPVWCCLAHLRAHTTKPDTFKGRVPLFFLELLEPFFFYGCMSLIDHVFSLKIILMVGGS